VGKKKVGEMKLNIERGGRKKTGKPHATGRLRPEIPRRFTRDFAYCVERKNTHPKGIRKEKQEKKEEWRRMGALLTQNNKAGRDSSCDMEGGGSSQEETS